MIEFLKHIALEESLDRTKIYRIGISGHVVYQYRKKLTVHRSGWKGMLIIFDMHRVE